MEREDSEDVRASLFGQSVSMDEMDPEAKTTPKGGDVKAEGDDIPEEYRGKSVSEIIKLADAAREGVRTATSAAEAARAAAELAASSRAPISAPAPEEYKELTREEIKTLYDEDPLKAIEVIEEQAQRRVNAHIEARLAPLTSGTMNAAENWARQEYPDEFELFEKDIKTLVANVPNKNVFTSKEGWQDAIAYVRGKGGNFEKLVDHRQEKQSKQDREVSRGRERATAGFTGRSTNAGTTRAPASDKAAGDRMSPEMKAVADNFINDGIFKDYNDYMDWYNKEGKMGMEEFKAQQAALNRIEEKEVPGLRVRTPRAKMLDVREVQKRHPDRHLRWVSIREEEKAESRKEEGYVRLTSEEGGRQIGKELVLMSIPKELAEARIKDQEDLNAQLLDAHRVAMRAEAESAARYLRENKGLKITAADVLISE